MYSYSYPHKICDPIHGFIRYDDIEKSVIDSSFFQRLRYIRQMGVAYLLYPGATHTRFEHSLGVMELVSRIYDTITAHATSSALMPHTKEEYHYWRQILRLAALCHDMGHLPFSHTAEKELLPEGHESKTIEIINSHLMSPMWDQLKRKGRDPATDIIKLAVGPHHGFDLTPWEKMLAKLITEDNFGADRIDYLIRDGYYTGARYGHLDFHQLIDSLRIFSSDGILTVGVLESGIQSVESLWIARYLMYERVYHHKKGRVFTSHMSRFMKHHFEKNGFPASLEGYLELTDYTVLQAMQKRAHLGDYDAKALLYQVPAYKMVTLNGKEIPIKALLTAFGEDIFIDDLVLVRANERKFFVIKADGSLIPSLEASRFLREIPIGGHTLCLYAKPEKVAEVSEWLVSTAAV